MKRLILPLLTSAALLPFAAGAHRSWMLPSSTVLSGEDPWVTVDAAVSNDLFYFDHNPGRLNGLIITAPDGSAVQPQNTATGKFRSTFDVHLTQKGTYKLAIVNDGVTATYTENGETKRWRGSEDKLKTEVPANAKDLRVTHSVTRQEVFVTSGSPTQTVFATSGKGIELAPITHPNDLFAKEAARFRFLLDGKPGAHLKVTVIRGGIRYRNALEEMSLTTNANGEVAITWPEPGMYWLSVSSGEGRRPAADGPESGSAAPQNQQGPGPGGPGRRTTYSVTLEVLPQ